MIPQRLKPDLFSTLCVRAEARTLQKDECFRTLLYEEAKHIQHFVTDFYVIQVGFFNEP
jgi:hypothetical protein